MATTIKNDLFDKTTVIKGIIANIIGEFIQKFKISTSKEEEAVLIKEVVEKQSTVIFEAIEKQSEINQQNTIDILKSNDFATKGDLLAVKNELKVDIDDVKADIIDVKNDIKLVRQEIKTVASELRTEIANSKLTIIFWVVGSGIILPSLSAMFNAIYTTFIQHLVK